MNNKTNNNNASAPADKSVQISGCRKNIMGTISFDGKFPGMRKEQDFIVYPMQDSGEVITIQSDNRLGKIHLGTGQGVIRGNPNKSFLLADEERETLRQWIKSSGGVEVGGVVKCNNIGAIAL